METRLKKWLVRYTTKSGDYEKCWVSATDRESAEDKVRHEYWNVDDIISISLMD